jgi:hypothetical protein
MMVAIPLDRFMVQVVVAVIHKQRFIMIGNREAGQYFASIE